MTYLTVKTLSHLDAGYLAGLIDGEGTITLSRRNLNKHRALVITISSTELSILKYVQEITGVGKITNKRVTKANHTPSFTYQVANQQALDILKQIADHLRSYKADRARLALQDYTRLTPRNGRYSPVQIRERTQFVEKFLAIRADTVRHCPGNKIFPRGAPIPLHPTSYPFPLVHVEKNSLNLMETDQTNGIFHQIFHKDTAGHTPKN